MATATRGCTGAVFVRDLAATGGTEASVGGLRSWELSEESESVDASELNASCATASIAGSTRRSVSLEGFWDDASGANQGDLTVGNIVHLEIYPEGTGSGSAIYDTTTGGATVLTVTRGGAVDGLVSLSCTLEINGDLTTTAVP